jgi:hypothetical protein
MTRKGPRSIAPALTPERTWVEIAGEVYGAKPDRRGPIGGGRGYRRVVKKGDYTVEDLDALLDAISKARAGQVVLIPGEREIDLTARIYIEHIVLKVPEGVTLAGNRGQEGSQGALLTSDALDTPAMIRTAGPNARITGLRIQGPNPKRYQDHHRRAFGSGGPGHEYYYKFPVSDGIVVEHPSVEVDNCVLSAFGHAAVLLTAGGGHHVHHNHIHHCQYDGLGYGLCHLSASSLIEYNLFDWNRHSIAGTGEPGCSYVARNNVQLGVSLSHCFDMHGGRDRNDGTVIAGTAIEICSNTFRAPNTPVKIRGVPQEKCDVHHNWFVKHTDAKEAVFDQNWFLRMKYGESSDAPRDLSGRTRVFDNAYGDSPESAR